MRPTTKQRNAILLNLPQVCGYGWTTDEAGRLADLVMRGEWEPEELSLAVGCLVNWYRSDEKERERLIKDLKWVLSRFPSWAAPERPAVDYGKLERALDLIAEALDQPELAKVAGNFRMSYMGMPPRSALSVYADVVGEMCRKGGENAKGVALPPQ